MLHEHYSPLLSARLISQQAYHPFPRLREPGIWDFSTDEMTKLCVDAEALVSRQWPILPASLYTEFSVNGNRSNFEGPYFERRRALMALLCGELAERKGRFTAPILDLAWAICEESSWVIPAHNKLPLPDLAAPWIIDLFSAATGSLLSWVWYFLSGHESATTGLLRRIEIEIDRRIIEPYRVSSFGWMGFDDPANHPNNWNPWINSNILPTVLILVKEEARREELIHKLLLSVDRFLAGYHPDGGCDEGPGYWNAAGASLFDFLDILHGACGGASGLFNHPLISAIGRYLLRMHISDTWFVNFADGGARINITADLVRRWGELAGDAELAALGKAFPAFPTLDTHCSWFCFRTFTAFANAPRNREPRGPAPLPDHEFQEYLEVLTARETKGSARGFFLAAKGGHNNESHNHNDVGNFIVFLDGDPVLIDAGVETYTGKTFSPRRYEIWTMQSAFHNLPTVNGRLQEAGPDFKARSVTCRREGGTSLFSLDIASAYPPEAGLKEWTRVLQLDRELQQITIEESFETRSVCPLTLSLLTPRSVKIEENGLILDGFGSRVRLTWSGLPISARVETLTLTDQKLRSIWGPTLFRVLLDASPAATRGRLLITLHKAP